MAEQNQNDPAVQRELKRRLLDLFAERIIDDDDVDAAQVAAAIALCGPLCEQAAALVRATATYLAGGGFAADLESRKAEVIETLIGHTSILCEAIERTQPWADRHEIMKALELAHARYDPHELRRRRR